MLGSRTLWEVRTEWNDNQRNKLRKKISEINGMKHFLLCEYPNLREKIVIFYKIGC